MNFVKLVIVGDGSIGKTCVMVRFTERSFNSEYVPTVFDNKTHNIEIEGSSVSLSLWDTAGQQAYSRLRSVAYPNTDIFLIAFSVVNPESFINAKKTWVPQVQRQVPNAKILFVGTKIDLRESMKFNSPNQRPLNRQQIQKNIKQQFNAPYLQCSALVDVGINQIFMEAARMVLVSRGILKSKDRKSVLQPKEQQQIKQVKPCYCQLI